MVVKIKAKAYKRMQAFGKKMKDKEIGGLILGEINKATGNVIVKDVIILKQYYDASNFEIKDEALMDITKEWDGKKLKSVLGWWHSHNTGNVYWSGNDSGTFRRLCDLSNFCLGIVVAFPPTKNTMDLKCRLDIKDRMKQYISIDDIKPVILVKKKKLKFFGYNWDDVDTEIQENVEEDKRVFVICKHCQGQGMVEADPYKEDTNELYQYNPLVG